MLYSEKKTEEYNDIVDKVIKYAKKSGFEDIKADFSGYQNPASINMVGRKIKFTPDFSAKKGKRKFYFELAVKNSNEEKQRILISKWKALEQIAKMKGGKLSLFVPHGSYKYATDLLGENNIEATLKKLNNLKP